MNLYPCPSLKSNDEGFHMGPRELQTEDLSLPNRHTLAEVDILLKLASAYNSFVQLDEKGPHDEEDFRRVIDDAQKIIAIRLARRIEQEVYHQYK